MIVGNHDLDLSTDSGWLCRGCPALGTAPGLAGGVSQFLGLRLAWARAHASLPSCYLPAPATGGAQPGGQAIRRPPSTWAWTWKTVCPACAPVLKTTR